MGHNGWVVVSTAGSQPRGSGFNIGSLQTFLGEPAVLKFVIVNALRERMKIMEA